MHGCRRSADRECVQRCFLATSGLSTISKDISIGYLNHTEAAVRLYLQETFTFPLLTTEAAVVLVPPGK